MLPGTLLPAYVSAFLCSMKFNCPADEIWRAEIKADEAEARIRAREPAPLPAPIPAALFYGRIH
jgi:hypothetical protein